MSAYGFTEDSARRIARVVKSVEGDTTAPATSGPRFSGSTMSVVKVTAGYDYGAYTGQRVDYHAGTVTFADQNEIKIKELNNGTLVIGRKYMGQFSGYDPAGKPLFIVDITAEPTGSATIEVVSDIICTPTGIEVQTVQLVGRDYDSAIIRQFLGLSDVIPVSYTAQQNRLVKVNSAATGLEFGLNAGTLEADISTIKGDVVTLKANMVTARANIVTLQGDVTTLQYGYADLLARIIALEAP